MKVIPLTEPAMMVCLENDGLNRPLPLYVMEG